MHALRAAVSRRSRGSGRLISRDTSNEWPVSTTVGPAGLSGTFADAFGHPPSGVWHAPAQATLMGEHTADSDGLVLPIALPWGVSLAFTPTTSGVVELCDARRAGKPARFRPANLHPPNRGRSGWADRVAGVFWAAHGSGQLPADAGARILLDSDPRVGASVASSAAVECATLLSLVEAFDLDELGHTRTAMARTTQRAQAGFLGVPTATIDKSACLRCKEAHALFLDCRTGGARTLPLPLGEAGLRLLLIDTHTRHRPNVLARERRVRRAQCQRAARQLGVDALRDVADLDGALGALGHPVLARRVRHVVTEIHRVNATVGLVRAGGAALPQIGPVFNASHLSLRDQFEVSCPEVDLAVEAAVGAGARGARMTGGDLGRTAIALVAEDRLAAVREAVTAAFTRRRWRAPAFSDALPAAGARRLA